MLQLNIIGHLGNDAQVKDIEDKKVISFSVATSKKFKTRTGETKDVTTWVSCSYWITNPAVAQYLKKGTQVFCQGEMAVYMYDSQHGEKKTDIHLTVRDLKLLSSQKQDGTSSQPGSTEERQPGDFQPLDDAPF